QQVVDGRTAHTQLTRGVTDVALAPAERFHQHLALRPVPCVPQGEPSRLRYRLDGEVLGLDEPSAGHDDGTLDGVLQLADVARPAMAGDGLDGRQGEPQLATLPLPAATEERVGEEHDGLAAVAA